MSRELLHIYGPFAIQWYGVMILLGLIAFIWAASQSPLRKKYLTEEQFYNCFVSFALVGMLGGRLLYVIETWHEYESFVDIFKVWEGGFSLLGGIAILLPFAPWYLWRHKIPILPVLDLAGLYTPITQSLSRLGCLFAGCCYGTIATTSWAVTCIDPTASEFYGKLVHPTQLYSAIALCIIFLLLRYVVYPAATKQGQICAWYLIFVGAERFLLDFWRADRATIVAAGVSSYQFIALGIILFGFGMLTFCSYIRPQKI